MHYRFCIKTLGCKVNIYESEYIYGLFVKKGYIFSESNPDVFVVNTCSVTNMSDRKSRQVINSIRKCNPNAIIIVCGCYSQNAFQTGKLDDIDADIILGNKDKSKIIEYLEDYLLDKKRKEKFYDLRNASFEDMEISSEENRTRAFVKIEDGCNSFCSYCIIPYVRGCVRCKSKMSVLNEVKSLVDNGHKEIVLTGIHTGMYNDNGYLFSDLLSDLVKIPGLVRLRISSIEINELNDKVLEIFRNSDVLVPHLHIPLQSGSEKILKDMNRKYSKDFYRDNKIKSVKKDISITTDVIVGFPGETDDMHRESLDFIREIGFTKVHTFPYSDRYGTVASKLPNKVDGNVKKRRVRELLNLSDGLESEFYQKFYNVSFPVLIEEVKDNYFIGHTPNFIKVRVQGDYVIHNIYDVVLNKDNIIR